jgi:arylsulfatase A-like enzyme
MSLYGYERDTTPGLEALAREAVVFDEFFNAGGATLLSHATLFTSLYPGAHGVDNRTPIRRSERTLAEVLHARGYRTAGFSDVVWLTRKYGFAQGFDHYDDAGGNLAGILPRVDRWLERRGDEPFFLFLHLFDVHSSHGRLPYDSPEGANERYTRDYLGMFDGCRGGLCATLYLADIQRRIRHGETTLGDELPAEDLAYIVGLYDGGIRYVDDHLAAWFEQLRRKGLWENTLLVVLSDHGEEFGEHGNVLHGHGTAYEEFVHIPLLLKLPGSRHGGHRVGGLASMIDVMPTVLDVLGIDPPVRAQGRSLLPLIEAGEPLREHLGVTDAVRSDRWKLVESRPELYDLAADPAERENRYEGHPEVVAELEAVRREIERSNEAAKPGGAPAGATPLSPEEKERLRALGYLDEVE